MDFLGRIRKLDSSLQRGLDNSFARVFGGKVVSNELEECLKQEAEDFLMQDENGRFLAPNEYRIGVSPKDFENLSSQQANLPSELADQMSRYCRNNGWSLPGSVTVQVQQVESLHTGQLKTASNFTEGFRGKSGFVGPDGDHDPATEARQVPEPAPVPPPAPAPVPAPDPAESWGTSPSESRPVQVPPGPATPDGPATTVVLLLQDGSNRKFEVKPGSNIIGRGTVADFRLPDTGVSRQHAEITWDGRDAVLVDLHSTNGTMVNDSPIDNWLLADGDVISMGHSVMEVQIR